MGSQLTLVQGVGLLHSGWVLDPTASSVPLKHHAHSAQLNWRSWGGVVLVGVISSNCQESNGEFGEYCIDGNIVQSFTP